jgi:hypothetical protein
MEPEFNATELQIFAEARAQADGLRRNFESWCAIGRAVVLARQRAEAAGGSFIVKGKKLRSILEDQGLPMRRNESSQFLRVMAKLPEVRKWRETLTPFQAARWSSFQSTENRAPCFRNGRPPKGPVMKARAMSVNELLKMPSEKIVELLLARNPPKAFAIARAFSDIGIGTAARLPNGWAAARAAKGAVQPHA